jgi:hemoglobin-like flavoprotein
MLTTREIELVQGDWEKVATIEDAAATLFYERLFALDAQLQPMFPADLGVQKKKLMQTIGVAVMGLGDVQALIPAVQALGRRHAGYGVQPQHYDTVGAALLWTLKAGLGDSFDSEHESAWTKVYGVLAQTMITASR